MPRMPRPGEYPGGSGQSGSWIPSPSYNPASGNIKLKVLEDKLRDDLAPQDMEILSEISELHGDSYLYVYDTKHKQLKRISSSNLGEIVMQDVDHKIESQNILNYTFVSRLPRKADAKTNTIYIVPAEDPKEQNRYDEYLFIKEIDDFNKFGSVSVDLSKYRTAAEQDLLNKALEDLLLAKLSEHTLDHNNPHHVTKEQLGIDDSPELKFLNHYEFPNVGEMNRLYIATDEALTYFWDGDHYVVMKASMPNITIINGGNAPDWTE